ncbi:MAG: hypothetical protein A2498_15765 [Lentisphaerae bacterium RIFOXYC12_FULL_60_16]|nr:MAG: hypothetical protein A2498_15765 [Lentisphaerae bacterium RIFOXYC12_FULL_60_16]
MKPAPCYRVRMRINGFDILDKIGENPIATVWKAHQASLNRDVAIKVFKPAFTNLPGEMDAILNDARAVARLKHPSILPIFEAGVETSTGYLIMDLVAGPTLFRILHSKGAMPWKDAMRMIIPVAEALEHAWTTANLSHRGLKPTNIFLDTDGIIKVSDFGMARLLAPTHLSRALQSRTLTITTNYCSPEQASCGVQTDFHTDMYSLGAILYHLVTGQLPFTPATPIDTLEKHRQEKLPNPCETVSGLHRSVEMVISRLMMKGPDDRYPNWADALTDLRKAAAGTPVMRSTSTTGVSTITPLPPVRLRATEPAAPSGPPPSAGVPAWIRIPAWLGLCVWFGLVGYQSYHDAEMTPPASPNLPTPVPPSSAPIPQPRTPPPPTRASHLPPAGTITDKPAAPSPVTSPSSPPESSAPSANDIVDNIIAGILPPLLRGEFELAAALIDQELQFPQLPEVDRKLTEMGTLLNEAARAMALIEAEFRSKTGQVVTINNRKQQQQVTIRSVKDGVVDATIDDPLPGGGTAVRLVQFKIAQLDPEEQARWLGNADTPGKALVKCALFLRARNFPQARQFAASTGPLAPLLLKQVDAP